MTLRLSIPLLMLLPPLMAEEPNQPRPLVIVPATQEANAPSPATTGVPGWLGVDVTKPDHTLITHLPALPPGVGFIVKSVHADGPAHRAGVEVDDVMWKLEDQLLINEAQLSTLLHLHNPGDVVNLTVFRRGSQVELPVTLGASPPPGPNDINRAAEEAVFHGDQVPMRVINLAEREAFIANSEGRAVVRQVPDGYWLTIENSDGEILYDDRFDRTRGTAKCIRDESIPIEWKRRAYALRRGLDHALDGAMSPQRQPRPRVVPPPDDR